MEELIPAVASMGVLTIILIVVSVVCAIVGTIVPLVFVFKFLGKLSKAKAQNAALIQTGEPGRAKILQVGTGSMVVRRGVQRSVQLNATLEVHPGDGSPPYEVRISPLIPEIAMASLQPGSEIPVKISATDQNQIAIDLPAMGFMV